jgi:hypothetical protein
LTVRFLNLARIRGGSVSCGESSSFRGARFIRGGSGNFFEMARNFCGLKVREAPGLRRFAEALNFQSAHGFLLLEQEESGSNDFTRIAESSIANVRLNKRFEVGRDVDDCVGTLSSCRNWQ